MGDRDATDERVGGSGHVVVRLQRGLLSPKADTLPDLADEVGLADLTDVLDRLRDGTGGQAQTIRAITSVAVDALLAWEKAALGTDWSPRHSLSSYWRLDARALGMPAELVAELLNQVRAVDVAYAEAAVSHPGAPVDDPLGAQQGYLEPAPMGTDARWARTRPGGLGEGVGVVDVESGWLAGHPEFAPWAPLTPLIGDDEDGHGTPGHHGAAVLGVIAAAHDALGLAGATPTLRSLRVASHFRAGAGRGFVADAICAARQVLEPGDVIVLEVQRDTPELPAESDPVDLEAIRCATAAGIITVAAAGNGRVDLDTWARSGRFRLRRGHPDFDDSGSVLVGAGRSAVREWIPAGAAQTMHGHERHGESNHGGRVDCYAWGEHVATTGFGDLSAAGTSAAYTATFDKTSAATAIVAAAAVAVQGMYRAATGGDVLTPAAMRAALSNPATGTPQHVRPGRPRRPVGVMPDLRRIAGALGIG